MDLLSFICSFIRRWAPVLSPAIPQLLQPITLEATGEMALQSLLQSLSSPTPVHAHPYVPYLLALIGSIIWPLSWVYSNQHNLSLAETTLVRGLTTMPSNYLLCLRTGSSTTALFTRPPHTGNLLLRSLILTVTSLMVGTAQYMLPLPIIHTVVCSSTLFIFVLDYVVNGVTVHAKQAVGIGIGIGGMLLAANCEVVLGWIQGAQGGRETKYQYYLTDDARLITAFTVVFIGVMVLWAYAMIITKDLPYNTFQINYVLGMMFIFSSALVYQFIPPPAPSLQEALPFYKAILYTGLPLIVDQWLLILAIKMSKNTGIVSMIYFNSIVVGYVVGLVRYGQHGNMVMNLGVGLLAVGMYWTLVNGRGEGSEQGDGDARGVEGRGLQELESEEGDQGTNTRRG